MTGRLASLATVVAIAMTGVSCSSDDASATVEFLVFGEPEEIAAYQSVVDAFEADHDIDIELITAATRSDLLTRISTSIAAGEPPELFLVNYRFYGQFASKGALEPLTDRIAESSTIDPADYYQVAMEAFEWDGEQMCLPQNVSSLAVYYNRDLFESAGVDEPADGWNWFEMVDTASALTLDVDDDGTTDQYGLGVEPGIIRLAPFVWSAGGEVFDDDDHPTAFTLDSAQALTAVQRFLDLSAGVRVVPSDEEMEAEDLESRFMNGRLAMFMSSRRSVPQFRSIEDFSWDVAPIPVNSEPANVLHSDAFCLTADSEHHDQAWEFVEFALGAEGQRLLSATGRTVPSRIEVAESAAFLDPSSPPSRATVFLDAIPHIRRLPTLSTWPEIEDIADVLIEEAMFDTVGGDVPDALTVAEETVELVTALRTETLDAFERAHR